MRKVLLLAYRFPPIVSSGVQRPVKFVKYLRRYGWQPFVLSTDKCPGDILRDYTLCCDIPSDAPVWRIPSPDPHPLKLVRACEINLDSSRDGNGFDGYQRTATRVSTMYRHALRAVLFPITLLEYPPIDRSIYWVLRVLPRAVRIIRDNDIDIVMTTCPPWSTNVLGLLIRIFMRTRWVADFRDPWTINEKIYNQGGWRRYVDRAVEQAVLACADAVIGVTDRDEDGRWSHGI